MILDKQKKVLVQAPMAGSQGSALTIAVCLAGEIGSLAAALLSPEQLADELARIGQAVGARPYNVNFFAYRMPEVDDAARQQWLDVLQPFFDEFGLRRDDVPLAPSRRAFDGEMLAVLQQYRPPVVSFHFGLPDDALLDGVRATGAQIWASATTVQEAEYLAQRGVDAVIAQGWEAGGHRSMFLSRDLSAQKSLAQLLPEVVAAVGCPVIAAGGIAHPEAVRRAFELGASAVQAGSAFLTADEAKTSAAHRQALLQREAADTVVGNIFSGGYARALRNRFIEQVGAVCEQALPFPHAGSAAGLVRSAAEQQGDYGFTPFWAGGGIPLRAQGSAAAIIAYLKSGL